MSHTYFASRLQLHVGVQRNKYKATYLRYLRHECIYVIDMHVHVY